MSCARLVSVDFKGAGERLRVAPWKICTLDGGAGAEAPGGVLDVWQTKDLREGVFGSVARKGVMSRFFGCVANKRLSNSGD